jgi:tetratricopeptide (TPR) repeat protein
MNAKKTNIALLGLGFGALLLLSLCAAVLARGSPRLADLIEEYNRRVLNGERDSSEQDTRAWIDRFTEAIRQETTDRESVWFAKAHLETLYASVDDVESALKIAEDRVATAPTFEYKLRAGYEAVDWMLELYDRTRKDSLAEEALQRLAKLRADVENAPDLFERLGGDKLLIGLYASGLLEEASLRAARGATDQAVRLCLRAVDVAQAHDKNFITNRIPETALSQAMETLAKAGDIGRAEEMLGRLAALNNRSTSMAHYVLRLANIESPDRGPKYWQRLSAWFQSAPPEDNWQDGFWGVVALQLADHYAVEKPQRAVEIYHKILDEIAKRPGFPDVPGMQRNCWIMLADLYGNRDKPCYNPQRAAEYATRYLKECGPRSDPTVVQDMREVLERVGAPTTQPAQP